MWLLEQMDERPAKSKEDEPPEYLPLAMQWGRNMLYFGGAALPQATRWRRCYPRLRGAGGRSVRNWNVDQPDTWSAIGHFSIATRTQVALSNRLPKLVKLMDNNARIISHDDATILKGEFTGMGSADFVALADVPDFYWKPKIAKQGHARLSEGPNHFADMDQPNDAGRTRLTFAEPLVHRSWQMGRGL